MHIFKGHSKSNQFFISSLNSLGAEIKDFLLVTLETESERHFMTNLDRQGIWPKIFGEKQARPGKDLQGLKKDKQQSPLSTLWENGIWDFSLTRYCRIELILFSLDFFLSR